MWGEEGEKVGRGKVREGAKKGRGRGVGGGRGEGGGGGKDFDAMLCTMRRARVATTLFVPSHFNLLLAHEEALAACTQLKMIMLGGEAVPVRMVLDVWQLSVGDAFW